MALTKEKLLELINSGQLDDALKGISVVIDYPDEPYAGQTIDRIVK